MTSGGVARVFKLRNITDALSIRCSSGKPNKQQTVALGTAFVIGRRPVRSTWTPAADLTSPRYLDRYFTLSISTLARESAFARLHSSDANILFADGKVQFISENVDLANIWNLLVSPNEQELVGKFQAAMMLYGCECLLLRLNNRTDSTQLYQTKQTLNAST